MFTPIFHGQNRSSKLNWKNGYLYNSHAANAAIPPSDYRVALDSDFQSLESYIGGLLVAGKLKHNSNQFWQSPNTGAKSSYGFYALPSGGRSGIDGISGGLGFYGNIWALGATTVDYRRFQYDSQQILRVDSGSDRRGFSIRMVYTGSGTPTSVTDYDGNVYDVININGQYWTVQNWKCTHLNDGTALTKVTSNTTWISAGSGDCYYCAYDNDENNV